MAKMKLRIADQGTPDLMCNEEERCVPNASLGAVRTAGLQDRVSVLDVRVQNHDGLIAFEADGKEIPGMNLASWILLEARPPNFEMVPAHRGRPVIHLKGHLVRHRDQSAFVRCVSGKGRTQV